MTTKSNFNNEIAHKNNIRILILSGGGLTGISHIGVLYVLQLLRILPQIHTFAGSSIGALISGLIILNYSPAEIYDFIHQFHFEYLVELDFTLFFSKYGLDPGSRLEKLLKTLIKAKVQNENITLLELYKLTGKTLIVTSLALNTGKIRYISYKNYPQLPLYLALRMSMCIPFFYVPIYYKKCYYVDGGCVDNYPIGLFKHYLDEVLGVYLHSSFSGNKEINTLSDYTKQLIWSILLHSSRDMKHYHDHTIVIKQKAYNLLNFKINHKQKEYLFFNGYRQALDYFTYTV